MATFTKLNSGSWRVQVRRKGKYVNETFLRRRDAAEWALVVERRIDRGQPSIARRSRDAKSFGVAIERIKPGHPPQNGRHERMHLTLKQEATRPSASTAAGQVR